MSNLEIIQTAAFEEDKKYYEMLSLYGKEKELHSLSTGIKVSCNNAKRIIQEQMKGKALPFEFFDEKSSKVGIALTKILSPISKELADKISLMHQTVIPYQDVTFSFDVMFLEGEANFQNHDKHQNEHMEFFCWYMGKLADSIGLMMVTNQFGEWVKTLHPSSVIECQVIQL